MSGRNVLLLAHDGEDFYKARLPFAKFLKNHGFRVFVILPEDHYTELIQKEGFDVKHSGIRRDNLNPIDLAKSVLEIRRHARVINADIVHSFKFIPNLINSLAGIGTKNDVVLHIAGLGIAFANNGLKFRILKLAQQILFYFQFLRANLVIIQNPDDFNDFLLKEQFRSKIKLVKGSGVNVERFSRDPAPITPSLDPRKSVFLCTTRLIWEKGIREMVDAFESLPEPIRSQVELRIIGEPDTKNPRGVTESYIRQYQSSTVVRFLGRQSNIKEQLMEADVFILPSYYREGIPRSILEALAMGLPVITTDVPGCNLTIIGESNGLLIKPRSESAIREAVEKMMVKKDQWIEMGRASRQLALREFSENQVFGEIVKLYNR